MKLSRIQAIMRKEFIHIVRDSRSLGMAIAIPLLLLVLFGYALTLDVNNVPLAVWDQSQTPASREFVSFFQGSRYFQIHRYLHTYRELEHAIDSSDARMVLVIGPDFAPCLKSGRSASVQLIVDGSDSNTATIAIGYADLVVLAYSQNISLLELRRTGGRTVPVPLDLRPRVWFNTDMESKNFIIPGLIAMIMMVIAALLTSLTIAREWESGTMEQLISTPVKVPELITGKLLPYFAIGLFDVLLAVLMGEYLFKVPLRGSVALLFGMTSIFLVGALSIGMLVSIVTRSQLLASQFAMVLTILPAFLLSGFMSAISSMPRPIQILSHVIPARYFVTLLKGIYLKGIGLEVLAAEAGLLSVFGLAVLILANLIFKKKLV